MDTIDYESESLITEIKTIKTSNSLPSTTQTVLTKSASNSTTNIIRIGSSNSSSYLQVVFDEESQETRINISIVGISLAFSSIAATIIYVFKLKRMIRHQLDLLRDEINLENMPDSFNMAPFTTTIAVQSTEQKNIKPNITQNNQIKKESKIPRKTGRSNAFSGSYIGQL
jgi:hypothetical protein